MQLWACRYTLTPRRTLSAIARPGAREGALIRAGNGFADVHPWPELGDAPLDEQLALLARGETTPLTRASLHHARTDADARERGVSLFDGLRIPLSHWPGDDPPEVFDTAKVKGAASLPPDVRLRIDFNATLRAEELVHLADALPKERIDFVEDPCPYDADVWSALRAQTGLRLAFDINVPSPRLRGEGQGEGFDVLIHKPALHAEFPESNREVVVTSYMDHPVGQFHAAYVASTHPVSARCGLFTHVLYESNPFIERVRAEGARLLPPEGTGIGFDDLLEKLPWKKLA
ncbi:MAG TPA: enolase C-terminal domain-like protein [Thermoanaerobaculia bacterium]|nr:enolase C-terminal domain-like protein [Thermoanaerobaculia bacterium]